MQLGGSFSDKNLMLHILCNLPEEFENTVENNEKALTDGSLMLTELRGSLDSKFKRLSNGRVIQDTALYLGEYRKSWRINGKWSHCVKTGHTAENCWTLTKNKEKLDDYLKPNNFSKQTNNDSERNDRKKSGWVPYRCVKCGKKDTRDLTAPNTETGLRKPGKSDLPPQNEIGHTIKRDKVGIIKLKMMFV